ncbi:MAG: hypothetical protein E4H36_01445 [Spirochaetales bacterium]|nr:MAG: hypothetical protein E4H36_01445 [Spirochaetales bacterium]
MSPKLKRWTPETSPALPVFLLLVFTAAGVHASPDILARAESYFTSGEHEAGLRFLEYQLPELTDTREKTDALILLAQFSLNWSQQLEKKGARKEELLQLLMRGRTWADDAISLDPYNEKAYFWRASTLGRWGQVKGLFEALSRTREMREDLIRSVEINPSYTPSWYVLSMLYEQLPGGIISFGDPDISVSLGRKAAASQDSKAAGKEERRIGWDYYIQLARSLMKRNWDPKRRIREKGEKAAAYENAVGVFEKGSLYEGICEIESISDRKEAESILRWVVASIENRPQMKLLYEEDYAKAEELLKRF